jgi:hypothetical protein
MGLPAIQTRVLVLFQQYFFFLCFRSQFPGSILTMLRQRVMITWGRGILNGFMGGGTLLSDIYAHGRASSQYPKEGQGYKNAS